MRIRQCEKPVTNDASQAGLLSGNASASSAHFGVAPIAAMSERLTASALWPRPRDRHRQENDGRQPACRPRPRSVGPASPPVAPHRHLLPTRSMASAADAGKTGRSIRTRSRRDYRRRLTRACSHDVQKCERPFVTS
jgi:hypothetical protein